MSPSEPLLQLLNQTSKPMNSRDEDELLRFLKNQRGDTDNGLLRFIKAVKVAFQYNMKNYYQFLQVLRDFSGERIHVSGLKAKVKSLFKGHADLILEFNTFLSTDNHIRLLPPETMGKKGNFCELPWDLLDVISQTLDFEDLFQFSGVCKYWRTFHKSNFLPSQEPLLVEISHYRYPRWGPHCFSSLSNKKVYSLDKILTKRYKNYPTYVACSSGYFVILEDKFTVLLLNPFTRIKKVIYNTSSPFQLTYPFDDYHALLAFEKCSEEFVLLVLCKISGSLRVYQSRNNAWVAYSTPVKPEMVSHAVVLNNMIYVVTNKANIGVLSLNSANIKFLKLNNTPNILFSNLHLLNCDDQLLVVALDYGEKAVFKIDWSTMSYFELETLGDIALFCVEWTSCIALNNPNRWGYESNSVYALGLGYNDCFVYNWNRQSSSKLIQAPSPKGMLSTYDWCFRHLKYEVDFSLVD